MNQPTQPHPNKPLDFEKFWSKTLQQLQSVSAEIKTNPAPGDIQEDLIHEYISFNSLNDARIHGYVIRWKDDQPRPLVVYTHGYLDQTKPMWEWAQAGVNVLGFDVRGFGTSQEAVEKISEWGYVLTGIQSPEDHVLRGAVCDYIRAVEVGAELLKDKCPRITMQGTSFGGGLAMMAEALLQKADLLSVAVPTFGWSEGRYFFAAYGSGAEVNKYLEERHEEAEDVMEVLRYFDTMNFTDKIQCPTLVGIGQEDKVVPPETVYAIAHQLKCPHEIMEFPVSHTRSIEEEQTWKAFDERWLKLTLEGIPENFGA